MSEGRKEECVTVTLPRRLGNMRLGKARTGGKDPLLLLPEEVWRVVLDEVEDWRDIRNCSDTCSLFRRLVQESKTLNSFKIYSLFGKVLPHLCKYLDGGEILRCRAVCTAWNKGVDSFFESDKFHRPHSDVDSDPRRPQYVSLLREKGLNNNKRLNWDCIGRIMQRNPDGKTVARHGRNPFIGRNVSVSGDCPYLEALEAYGKHIWYLTVSFSTTWDVDTPDSFPVLRMVTVEQDRFFPNLRRLCIAGGSNLRWQPSVRPIHLVSLPLAPHLETLQINRIKNNFKAAPTLVESLLRKYHLQLGRLDVWLEGHLHLVSTLEWPKLTELRLDGRFAYGEGFRDYELLLRAKMPNLSKLALHQLLVVDTSWSELLEVIRKLSLSTRLTTLRISSLDECFPRGSKSAEDSCTAPESLKTLEVGNHFSRSYKGVVEFVESYSFLRHFPFLENLNIFWRSEFDNDDDEMMSAIGNILLKRKKGQKWKRTTQDADFLDDDDDGGLQVNEYLYSGEMYKSNIWEVLLRLKVLTFQMKCYTRDGYDKFVKRKQDSWRDVRDLFLNVAMVDDELKCGEV